MGFFSPEKSGSSLHSIWDDSYDKNHHSSDGKRREVILIHPDNIYIYNIILYIYYYIYIYYIYIIYIIYIIYYILYIYYIYYIFYLYNQKFPYFSMFTASAPVKNVKLNTGCQPWNPHVGTASVAVDDPRPQDEGCAPWEPSALRLSSSPPPPRV